MDAQIWQHLPRDIVRQVLWRSDARTVACLSKFWKEFATMKTQKEMIIEQLNLIITAFNNPVEMDDGSFRLAENFWDVMDPEVFGAWQKLQDTGLFTVYGIDAHSTKEPFLEILGEYEDFLTPDCLKYPRGQKPIVVDQEALANDCEKQFFLKGVDGKAKETLYLVAGAVLILFAVFAIKLGKKKKKMIKIT